jgi:flavin-dependent dehydrogenase
MERRPVIIVGSGPAGAATAIALHQRDRVLAREVLILEKTRHPRPKVCAGGLIPAGWRWLHEHDVPFDVPHVAVQRARVTTPSRTVEHEEANLCFVVRRNEFDAALVEAARERGTEVREDEPALSLDRDETGVRVTTARGVYHAATVIGADGAGSVVRRTLVNPGRDCLARAVMADVPVESSTWDGVERRRYDFDFRLLRRGIRGYLWAFPCVVDGPTPSPPAARCWTRRSASTWTLSASRRHVGEPFLSIGFALGSRLLATAVGWSATQPASTHSWGRESHWPSTTVI